MESLKSWNCCDCGRSEEVTAAPDATGKCSCCTDWSTSGDDATKRQLLDQLRDRYGEAQKLVSSRKLYANLEWILGAMSDSDQTASSWADRTLDLVALSLEDLAAEIDRLFPEEVTGEIAEGALPSYRGHRSLAQSLRAATEGFVVAFRHSAETVRLEPPARWVSKSKSPEIAALRSLEGSSDPAARFSQERGLPRVDEGKEPSLCVMCDHEKAAHTAGTDGAGWCGKGPGCDCGGFQECRLWDLGQPPASLTLFRPGEAIAQPRFRATGAR
jgi:hypothetical protein